jgi:hypothetical protein
MPNLATMIANDTKFFDNIEKVVYNQLTVDSATASPEVVYNPVPNVTVLFLKERREVVGGKLIAVKRTIHVQANTLDPTFAYKCKRGDQVLRNDGTTWDVQAADNDVLGTTWQLECVKSRAPT